jgi:pyruvate,orthophosphate dikinase
MIPMVFSNHEIDIISPIIMNAAKDVFDKVDRKPAKDEVCFDLGTMIELPRACLRAERIATTKHINFVSFGTNDLTQMVFGLSRDDTEQFMVNIFTGSNLIILTVLPLYI